MAEKGEVLTCEQLRTFHDRADALWKQWVSDANTNDQAEWDKAFVSYTTAMEDLRMAFGHPPGRPRKRP